MSIINPEFKCSYSCEVAKQLTEDFDAMEFFHYMLHLQLLGKLYKNDGLAYDIACKIANHYGFINFLKRKHTCLELAIFYNKYCIHENEVFDIEDDIDNNDLCLDYGEKIKLPEEKELSPAEKRAMLLKMKPNVKCNN